MIERIPGAADASDGTRNISGPGGLRCVVARSLRDVRFAASFERPLALLSARGAASFAGCLAWQALARAAREAFPTLVGADILDCADASGRALEALRLGQLILVLDERSVGFADVSGRAGAMGATVLPARPRAFDPGLDPRPGPGLRRALAAFLDGRGP